MIGSVLYEISGLRNVHHNGDNHESLCRAWSPVPLPICASHFWSLWNDSFRDVEHFDRFLIVSYVEVWFRLLSREHRMTHLPRLEVEFKHELLLLQTLLIIAQLGLLTDDYARRKTNAGWSVRK